MSTTQIYYSDSRYEEDDKQAAKMAQYRTFVAQLIEHSKKHRYIKWRRKKQ